MESRIKTHEPTRKPKSRTGVYIAIAIGAVVIVALISAIAMDNAMAVDKRKNLLQPGAQFADNFAMECLANPEIGLRNFERTILQDTMQYSEIAFVMELPPPDQVKKGSIYFAPSERTQEALDYFNFRISAGQAARETGFPVTMDKLIAQQEAMQAACSDMEFDYSTYEGFSRDMKASMADRLYGEVFMLQGAWCESADGRSIFLDKDRYDVAAVSTDLFTADAPTIDNLAEHILYLYPHKDGHTETLIANLNGIIAGQPGLLDGTGLAAPLTLDNILNDREQVWKIIHRLDSGQMARFRTH